MTDVTDVTFVDEVVDSDIPVLVDFWAPWCGPCRTLGPLLDSLLPEYEGRVKIVKLNVDDEPGTATANGIRSIPTLLMFKGGKVIDRMVKEHTEERIRKILDRASNG